MRTFGWTPTEGELQVQILQLYRGASQQISLFTALQGDQPTNQSFYSFTGGPVNKSVFLKLYRGTSQQISHFTQLYKGASQQISLFTALQEDHSTNQSFYSFTGEQANKSVFY